MFTEVGERTQDSNEKKNAYNFRRSRQEQHSKERWRRTFSDVMTEFHRDITQPIHKEHLLALITPIPPSSKLPEQVRRGEQYWMHK